MRRALFILIPIAILLAAALLLFPSRQRITKLPATITSRGVKITLKSVKRISRDKIKVTVWMQSPGNAALGGEFHPDDIKSPTPGCDTTCGGMGGMSEDYVTAKLDEVTCEQNIKIPRDLSHITLCPGFEIRRRSKLVEANIKNIDVKSLPVTRTFNGTDMTISKISSSSSIDMSRWQPGFENLSSGERILLFYTVEVSIRARGTLHVKDIIPWQFSGDSGHNHELLYEYYPLGSMPIGGFEASASPTPITDVAGQN